MSKRYVKVFYDWSEVTVTLSDAEKGRLITALVEYARSGEEIELSGAERHLFPMFQAQIDRDSNSYDSSVINGKKGGAPRGNKNATTKNNLKQPKTSEINQDKDKDKDKDKDNTPNGVKGASPPARAKFAPPTVEQVREYCKERKNNVDAQRFVDYYAAANWRDSKGDPVKNWKQKLISTWEKREGRDKHGGYAEPDYTAKAGGYEFL